MSIFKLVLSLKGDRTGTGVRSLFGAQMRFSLRDGTLPLLTTKKVFYRGIAEELFWFIKGSTDARELQAKKVSYHLEKRRNVGSPMAHFFVPRSGSGTATPPAPSWTLRASPTVRRGISARSMASSGVTSARSTLTCTQTTPDRAWTSWPTSSTRSRIARTTAGSSCAPGTQRTCLGWPFRRATAWFSSTLPTVRTLFVAAFTILVWGCDRCAFRPGELSCQLYQRSADMGLGVPFNIASYALLTHMIAHVTGLRAGDFVHTLGDAHVYSNHVGPLKEQLQREPRPFPKLNIKRKVEQFFRILKLPLTYHFD